MPGCSKAKHPSGCEITFTEDDHRYSSTLNGREIEYVSGTTFVHGFFPEFDPDGKILERCALKEGITPAELKKRWDKKRDDSCTYGTRCHMCCEDILLGNKFRNEPSGEKEILTFKTIKDIVPKMKQRLDVLGVERIVFNPFLPTPIAGTIDFLARSRKDGTVWILDWKTNEKIDVENRWNKFAKDPISHIPDINFYHYSLQLSLYQYLLTFGKYFPKNTVYKRAIVHLTPSGHEIHQLPDLTNEIKDMLIWNECSF